MNINQYIDHTNLKPFATENDIITLCNEAIENEFASVCINPCYVKLAYNELKDCPVKVCTVIGFPLGSNTTEIKVAEAKKAMLDGCDEFDMVINVGKLKLGNYEYVKNEISEIANIVNKKTIKVIIETGLLTDQEKAVATRLACEAGADYVKTCTGFSEGIATVDDIILIKNNLFGKTKIKASAGIKTKEKALELIKAGANRIGTSAGTQIVK